MMHRDRLLCVIDASTGSTVLPGSVVADVGGRTMLRFMLDRLAALRVDELVVVTTAHEDDDAVAAIASEAGVEVFRGDGDALTRVAAAVEAHPAQHVIRLAADAPLTDPNIVELVIARHLDCEADYTSNVLPRTFPRGLDVEMMRVPSLQAAHEEATDTVERREVTPFLYRRPNRFRLANVRNRVPLGAERWTIETAADLEFLRNVIARVDDGPWTWRTALAATSRRAQAPRTSVVLVPAGREHVSFFLACRNDADAIRHSRSALPIDRREHADWFASVVDQPGVRLRLAYLDGEAIGIARVDVHDGTGETVVAVESRVRNRGVGTAVVAALVADVATDYQVAELITHVHTEDEAARKVFERNDFVSVGEDAPFQTMRLAVPSM